jgi:hypothetical protein
VEQPSLARETLRWLAGTTQTHVLPFLSFFLHFAQHYKNKATSFVKKQTSK